MNQLPHAAVQGNAGVPETCPRCHRRLASVLVMLMLSLKKYAGSELFSFVSMLRVAYTFCIYVFLIWSCDGFEVVCAVSVVRFNHFGFYELWWLCCLTVGENGFSGVVFGSLFRVCYYFLWFLVTLDSRK